MSVPSNMAANLANLSNANSRSNPDMVSSFSNKITLALEPNPFEQSFARTDESSNTTPVQINRLDHLNTEKPLTKPQSDTQLNNLKNVDHQDIVNNFIQQHQEQQLQQKEQLQRHKPQQQLEPQNVTQQQEPEMINKPNGNMASKAQNNDSKSVVNTFQLPQRLESNALPSMSPPVLTPGGSKRLTSNLLPPLSGLVSPGGNSMIATPGLWNTLFPQSPNIQQQQQLQQQQQQQEQQKQQEQHQQKQQQQQQPSQQPLSQQPLPQQPLPQQPLPQQSQQQPQQYPQQSQQNKPYLIIPNSNEINNQQSQSQNSSVAPSKLQSSATSVSNLPEETQKQQQQQQQQQLYNFILNAKKSGLTPNESSLRTGLTPGSNGIVQNNQLCSYLSMAPGTPISSTIASLINNNGNNLQTNDKKGLHAPTGFSALTIPTLGNFDMPSLSTFDTIPMINNNNTDNNNNNSNTNNNNSNPIQMIKDESISLDKVNDINNVNSNNESSTVSDSLTNTPGLMMKPISHHMDGTTTNLINNEINGNTNNRRYSHTDESKSSNNFNTGDSSYDGNKSLLKRTVESDSRQRKIKKAKKSTNKNESAKEPPESTSSSTPLSVKSPSYSSTKVSRPRKKNLTEEEKRQNFLERNRVAASKCRKRKKEMIETMKVELEEYKDENKLLREQVGTLREHALTLRTILFAHRDCRTLYEQVGGIENLNTVLNATNYVSQLPEAHTVPESIMADEVPQLLNGSSTNVQAAVAAAVAHTTNKAIERQHRLSNA